VISKLWECLTVWHVPHTSLVGVQAIVAHAPGENTDGTPGCVNEFLADTIRGLYNRYNVPVIVQGELRACLYDVPLAAVSKKQNEAPGYLSTKDIVLWHKAECDKLGVRVVALVSFDPHFWRAMKATQKVGLVALVPVLIKEMYDPANSQWRWRYKYIARPYELLARLYFLWKGWI